ncbi:hypothetical protein [Streptomyces sp. MAR25Y5]|uniref:hypothetical protein n=1 Tax=Streptomyces sp. MAR25Y5 TaxID=2962028 RepID=UPI0020B6C212|nr:hypothetical protein [Streptomyces sp. MAR25Y5]MCP3769706.1 hypothetical protein [Streptomyces sp. MAR25Y5]
MPRGRHRHSPPLHRMLPPSAIAGVSLVCALGPWVFTQPMTLRLLAAAAAAVAVLGAFVMRHWDIQAGKQVADLTRARASDEWRFEERVAELESDLEESRELRLKLEHRLRAKRTELTGLRNEHAALLRRYAAAETDRATVLEERRVLEIEAAVPARALTAGPSVPESGALPDDEATVPAARTGNGTEDGIADGPEDGTPTASEPGAPTDGGEGAGRPEALQVFSPAGSTLFLRAGAALARLAAAADEGDDRPARDVTDATDATAGAADAVGVTDAAEVTDASGTEAAETTADDAPTGDGAPEDDDPEPPGTKKPQPQPQQPRQDGAEGWSRTVAEQGRTSVSPGPDTGTPPEQPARSAQPALPAPSAPPGSSVRRPPAGHFTVPTAVAVAPPTEPARRPVSDGTFDFFGTQNEPETADAAEEETPAPRGAGAEPEFEPAEDARGVGQVIDLTAHDEPEPAGEGAGTEAAAGAEAGTKGLRSAVS